MASCGSDESTPSGQCGNGTIEAGEQCDGANLNNATCASLMMGAGTGTPGCKADCTFDLGPCGGGAGGGAGMTGNP
jgi:cysteine-rich repeat protein